MDQPRHHFLTGSALAKQQDWNVDVRNQLCLRSNLAHDRAGSDEEYVVTQIFDLTMSVIDRMLFAITDALLDYCFQICLLERFGEVILSAHADRLYDFSRVADA